MASKIRVTPAQLKQTAEELRNLNTKFKNEVSSMNDSELRLATMYEGEAQKAFHNQFQTDRNKFETFYVGIEKYVQRLIDAADAYAKAENQNINTAQTRKA